MARRRTRGSLFAVCGRMTTFGGGKRRHGLYQRVTTDVHSVRWDPIKEPPISYEISLLKWLKGTVSPAEMVPTGDQYRTSNPWRTTRKIDVLRHYTSNESIFLRPAIVANDRKIRDYIYNILEPSHRRPFSGIGIKDTEVAHKTCTPIYDMVNRENIAVEPVIDFQHNYKARIKKLEHLIATSRIWSRGNNSSILSNNPFPYVKESESLVRLLRPRDVLFVRSNHRLNCKAHPRWYVARYIKYREKKRLAQKLKQLELEIRNAQA